MGKKSNVMKSKKSNVMISERERANKIAMICHWIEASIISFAYIMEIVKKTRTLSYSLTVVVVAMIPVILELIFYKKNKETPLIKHFIGYGFACLYIYIMMTTVNILAFVYVIPLLIIITVYNDPKFACQVGIGALIVNIVEVVMLVKKGMMPDTATIEIQILIILLVTVYTILASNTLNRISKDKLALMEEQKALVTDAMEKTQSVSERMVMQIANINDKTEKLHTALLNTKDSMLEVNTGSTDTADAVQKQLVQTEEIQSKVEQVTDGTENIIRSVESAKAALKTGNDNVKSLVEQAQQSATSGSQAKEQLESLDVYMKQMNSIVDIINEITTQTSLLALNASIEAARAGDAGRGFAVVASEITQMANKTQEATVEITELINNVSSAIENVIVVTNQIIDQIHSQNEITTLTAESFGTIETNQESIGQRAGDLVGLVSALGQANKNIIDSISTISAISEEVAAHASDTLDSSEANTNIVNDVVGIAESLQQLADELSR